MNARLPVGEAHGTVGAALARATRILAAAGVDEARRDARTLLAHLLGVDAAALFGRPEAPLGADAERALAALVERRAAREPVSRILGRREFWSLSFAVTADTLDPRPDSEALVAAALAAIRDRQAPHRVLDLGTGTGCLLLALLSELPNAWGLGVDIAPGAAACARANAVALGFGARTCFAAGDWAASLAGPFDVILVNPPYISDGEIEALAPEVARWEPRRALAGGSDGLDPLRAVATQIEKIMPFHGFAVIELGVGQERAAVAILGQAGLAVTSRHMDLGGTVRALVARRHGNT